MRRLPPERASRTASVRSVSFCVAPKSIRIVSSPAAADSPSACPTATCTITLSASGAVRARTRKPFASRWRATARLVGSGEAGEGRGVWEAAAGVGGEAFSSRRAANASTVSRGRARKRSANASGVSGRFSMAHSPCQRARSKGLRIAAVWRASTVARAPSNAARCSPAAICCRARSRRWRVCACQSSTACTGGRAYSAIKLPCRRGRYSLTRRPKRRLAFVE
jgi:hypothetical protein